ncbi:prepilin-type N-terminal cleavage/methylation domain-containing protein [Persephonella hydrogeniphila]|uniref:Prepilin-type N-terminal cleavage/methylation domain-containing protein n=1 Tax=Persephonella hydrogeniphila TaxID=198703 RepID=A0A285N4I4_9AQUI|nr:prepilin-type N-terminal cleavage/methylation domain-containing protein [Persephonella hydrogeniphila]SNZ02896.1 prepilin-type N-terminal cleavage/methylation domain-containing protein [Persephonella hydrogeniphila]
MKREKQQGFTLVELAIVLVIIGIILGAVLKGQELINNAKQKRVYSIYKEMLAAVYTYYDKYNALPGDDSQATTHLNSSTTANGDGNGRIDDGFIFNCTNTSTEESCLVFEHMRLANIISGSGRLNPQGPFGPVSIAYYAGGSTAPFGAGHWIAMQNIPYDMARSIDEKYDDGTYNTGSITADTDYSNTADKTLYFKF